MYKVLIVEDEMLVRIGIRSIVDWQRLGLELVGDAVNGKDALRYFDSPSASPDIVITDIRMPEMDGLALIERIRILKPECLFIILTCVEDFEIAQRAIHNQVSFYELKLDMTKESLEEKLSVLRDRLSRSQKGRLSRLPAAHSSLEDYLQRHLVLQNLSAEDFAQAAVPAFWQGTGWHFALALVRTTLPNAEANALENLSLFHTLEAMTAQFHQAWLVQHGQSQFIILFASQEKEAAFWPKLIDFFSRVDETVRSYFNGETHCALSTIGKSPRELQTLLTQCEQAMENSYFQGEHRVTLWEEVSGEHLTRQVEGLVQEMISIAQEERKLYDTLTGIVQRALTREMTKTRFLHVLLELFSVVCEARDEPLTALQMSDWYERTAPCRYAMEAVALYRDALQELYLRRNHSAQVLRAIAYIHKHYAEDIKIRDIADSVGYSPNYLGSCFKKECGQTLVDYIHHYRITQAKRLLRATDEPLSVIVERVGFSDENYFGRIFKRMTGQSVGQFRRQGTAAEEQP